MSENGVRCPHCLLFTLRWYFEKFKRCAWCKEPLEEVKADVLGQA